MPCLPALCRLLLPRSQPCSCSAPAARLTSPTPPHPTTADPTPSVQMRKHALRMLSETLSPASTRPTPLELSWIQVGWPSFLQYCDIMLHMGWRISKRRAAQTLYFSRDAAEFEQTCTLALLY